MNGSNSTIYVSPDREVMAWNRHGSKFQWDFSPETAAIFAMIPGRNWWVFNGELMHFKTRNVKHTHYLFDVLVFDGDLLLGTTYMERYERLFSIWNIQQTLPGYFVLDRYTWLARNYVKSFGEVLGQTLTPECEGLMLKRPEGRWMGPAATGWMTRVLRAPTD
jgi:ATP dependent DNA ligase domain